MQFLEVAEFISQCLCEQFVVVLSGCDVLREDGFFLQPGICVGLVEPVVGAFVLHDLQDATAINLPHILIMQVLVEPA
jgi:hypothetical protein